MLWVHMLHGIRSHILIICVLKCHINITVLTYTSFICLKYVVQYKYSISGVHCVYTAV
jgi:hypothetical protein